MAESAVVRARIDQRTKAEAFAVLAAMGLTVSDAFRLLMVRVAKEKTLPFELRAPNAKTLRAMKEAKARQPRRRTAKQQLEAWAKLRGRATVKMRTAKLLALTRGEAQRVERPAAGKNGSTARGGKSVARLTGLANQKSRIRFGLQKGKVKVAKDFNAALPSGVLADFEGR